METFTSLVLHVCDPELVFRGRFVSSLSFATIEARPHYPGFDTKPVDPLGPLNHSGREVYILNLTKQ